MAPSERREQGPCGLEEEEGWSVGAGKTWAETRG